MKPTSSLVCAYIRSMQRGRYVTQESLCCFAASCISVFTSYSLCLTQLSSKGCFELQQLLSNVLSFDYLPENLRLATFKSRVSVSPCRLSKYISLCLLLQKSINHSVYFGNLVPSLAIFRSLSYFRASTYTACIKIK